MCRSGARTTLNFGVSKNTNESGFDENFRDGVGQLGKRLNETLIESYVSPKRIKMQ